MALTILQKFVIRALVIAISVFIVPVGAVAFRHVIHRSLKCIALAVNGLKSAVELLVVAEVAEFAFCANCCEESSNISACGGCIRRIDIRVTLLIDPIAAVIW